MIDIFGFGQLPDGRQYLVMEYLNGTPLDQLVMQRAFSRASGVEGQLEAA